MAYAPNRSDSTGARRLLWPVLLVASVVAACTQSVVLASPFPSQPAIGLISPAAPSSSPSPLPTLSPSPIPGQAASPSPVPANTPNPTPKPTPKATAKPTPRPTPTYNPNWVVRASFSLGTYLTLGSDRFTWTISQATPGAQCGWTMTWPDGTGAIWDFYTWEPSLHNVLRPEISMRDKTGNPSGNRQVKATWTTWCRVGFTGPKKTVSGTTVGY